MELHAVEPLLGVLERRDRRRVRSRHDPRAGRRRRHRITVRHPRRLLLGQPGEERAFVDTNLRLAELGDAGSLDPAAEILRHQLHPVTDAERRHAEPVQRRVDPRRAVRIHGCRAAAQHERERVPGPNLVRGNAVADELGVDTALTDAASDQLRVLTAEVDDQHRPLLPRRLGGRQADDFPHQLRR